MRVAVALLVIAGLSASARAEHAELRLVLPEPGGVPIIEAAFGNVPSSTTAEIVLVDTTGIPPTEIHADATRSIAPGSEKLAVVVLVNGDEIWMGSDKEVPGVDEASRLHGALVGLRLAFDRLNVASFGNPESIGAIIAYSDAARILVPFGPLARLTGDAFGTQKDYYGLIGNELVAGLELAIAELRRVEATRRILLVIGDGSAVDAEAAKSRLASMKKSLRADTRGIELLAVNYNVSREGVLLSPRFRTLSPRTLDTRYESMIANLIPSAYTISSIDALEPTLRTLLGRASARMVATFIGYRRDRPSLVWDGKDHALFVRVGDQELDARNVRVPGWQPARAVTPMPWLHLGLVAMALLALAAGLYARRRFIHRTRRETLRA